MAALALRHRWHLSPHTAVHNRRFQEINNETSMASSSLTISLSNNRTTTSRDRKWDTTSNRVPILPARILILLRDNMALLKDNMAPLKDSMVRPRDNTARVTFPRSDATTRAVS